MLTYTEIATKNVVEVIHLLGSSPNGITREEAARRLGVYGANEIYGRETPWWRIFIRQFASAFIYLLFAASVVALFLGEFLDALIILIFLFVNALLGYAQEYRAEKSLALLKRIVARTTRVVRDGKEFIIPVRDVVPGDIVRLDAGDMVPADGYFLRADGVMVDESPITGESTPVAKRAGRLSEVPPGLYKADNIAFSKTTLLSGDAEILIFATANKTEVGGVANALLSAESPSAFEEGVSRFSRFVLKLVLTTIPIVFILNILVHGDTVSRGEFLLFVIALTVSVIPEALPLVTTISLTRGARELAKKHVVPRRLSAIEDLGSIDILATDKTGTITENKLTVAAIFGERSTLLRFALMAPLSAKGTHSSQNSIFDAAILAEDANQGHAKSLNIRRIDELPFDPLRRRGSVLVSVEGRMYLVVRGAAECCYAAADTAALSWAAEEGKKGRRVLAVAYKEIHDTKKTVITEEDESGLSPVGMISFADALKPTTKKAVLHAERLGVRVKIITGDSKEVAGWVGFEAGILNDPTHVLTSEEFQRMTEEQRAAAVEAYDVFARTAPLEKLAIIKKLQEKHLVGFLGEGFNDAPALKAAHVGLAVQGASDIAQDASDIVLLNRSLEVIVDGIKEGRKIFANTMKYLRATLTSNFGNFYALAFAALFVPFLPMLPTQVLLLNLLSDFPMITIAADTVDESELKRPRGYQVSELTAIAVILGIISTLFDFAFFGYFVRFGDPDVLRTTWFMGSILTELILLFSIRTTLPFWRAKRPSSMVLSLTLAVMAITIILPFTPIARGIFGFIAPSAEHLRMLFFLVALYFASTEIAKLLFYKYWNGTNNPTHGIVKYRHSRHIS